MVVGSKAVVRRFMPVYGKHRVGAVSVRLDSCLRLAVLNVYLDLRSAWVSNTGLFFTDDILVDSQRNRESLRKERFVISSPRSIPIADSCRQAVLYPIPFDVGIRESPPKCYRF
jgi:hypothetical protein